jgi:SAM-dependent methyltransferase
VASAEPTARRRQRRSLSHVGGAVRVVGATPRERDALTSALDVSSDEESTLLHVHGFHTYPARLHPASARGLVEAFSAWGDVVLDPFCGSGTVLVEARALGRKTTGNDANPLAVELTWLKTMAPGEAFVERIEATAKTVAESAEARRKARAGATRRYGEEDVALFDPHVLLELDGLRDAISRVDELPLRRALLLVLSASLTKFSKRSGDTAPHEAPKRIASGYPIRFFVKKAHELELRLKDYAELLPPRAPLPRLTIGDARRLDSVRPSSVDLVVTSPPYPGVYDYVEQHRARLRWLGLSPRQFENAEIGARRHARALSYDAALSRWQREFGAVLSELARVLTPKGQALLVLSDSVLAGKAVYADDVVEGLARKSGLVVAARAAQERPHFHAPTANAFRKRPRAEHVLLLRRNGA